jgi:hypothetical protein
MSFKNPNRGRVVEIPIFHKMLVSRDWPRRSVSNMRWPFGANLIIAKVEELSCIYRMNNKSMVLLALMLCARGLADTTEASPAPRVAYQAPLSDVAYAKAVASLPQNRIDPSVVAEGKFPTWGSLVVAVEPGSRAEQAGLTVGSLMDRLNGKEFYNRAMPLDPGANGMRLISWVTPDGVRHQSEFGPGLIGFTWSNGHRPENYLYQNSRHGKWDRDLLIASVAWQSGDHVLAETALLRARSAGLPTSIFTTYFEALLEFDHGNVKKSRDLYDKFLGELPAATDKIHRFFHLGLSTLATAFQDFRILESVTAEDRGLDKQLESTTLGSWKEWVKKGPHESLMRNALDAAGDDVMKSVVMMENKRNGMKKRKLGPLKRGWVQEMIPIAHYSYYTFAPADPFCDVIWQVRLALGDAEPLGLGEDEGIRTMTLSIEDRSETSDLARGDQQSQMARTLASICFQQFYNGDRLVIFAGGPSSGIVQTQHYFPLLNLDQISKFEKSRSPLDPNDPCYVLITLIRLGDQAEILLDGRSVFHIPLDSTANDVGFKVESVGTSFSIGSMTLRPIRQTE